MTAEIAIMNKEAIALAADSAVTTTGESGQKIFTSANKLFSLSKYHPVGIMIYGSASLMGVPWETIIKIHRNNLGKRKFNTVEEYAKDFMKFLDNGNPLFPEEIQEEYLRNSIYSYFNFVKGQIEQKVHSEIDEKGETTDEEIGKIVSDTIEEHYRKWQTTPKVPSIPRSFNRDMIAKYGKLIDEAIEEVFEKLPMSKSSRSQLRKIPPGLFSKFPEGIEIESLSGVVIAGFGEEETFPSLKSFHADGIVFNKLKYKEHFSGKVGFNTSATIFPFAQSEMVTTFMEGIDPKMQVQIESYLSRVFEEYPEIIVENIEGIDSNHKRLLTEKLKGSTNSIFNDYKDHVKSYVASNYVDPVLSVVDMLPKDELAAMAESLVNLTSFKRKVSMQSETVGGPIDVAVISKGDGFVWIKRKHYFKPELNPHFFANYYKEA